MKEDQEKENIVRTTVWSPGAGCHGGCGVKLHVKNGRLVKVEGDENHPWNQGRLCPRVLALTQYVYHPDRLLYPVKRAGERGKENGLGSPGMRLLIRLRRNLRRFVTNLVQSPSSSAKGPEGMSVVLSLFWLMPMEVLIGFNLVLQGNPVIHHG